MNGLIWLTLFAAAAGVCVTLMVLGITVAYAQPMTFLIVLGTTVASMVAIPFVLYIYNRMGKKVKVKRKTNENVLSN